MHRAVGVAVLLAAGAASAGTVQGTLGGDTTWTVANSPYTLTGDVIVPAGVSLTIESGVQVIAATTDATSSGSDSSKVELISRGTLRVRGTEASPVTHATPLSGRRKPRSIGVPLPDTEAKIVDPKTGAVRHPVFQHPSRQHRRCHGRGRWLTLHRPHRHPRQRGRRHRGS